VAARRGESQMPPNSVGRVECRSALSSP
jgi:hypothetical protein